MHRIPKIFAHSPNRQKASASYGRGAGSGSAHGAGNPKRRLQRLNARKNINYEPSPSSVSASSSSSSSYSPEESPRTSLIDLYGGKTSFRVVGSYEEIEILCRSLGFAGIDDLAIPAEECEAMKVKSSYAPLGFNQKIEHLIDRKSGVNNNDVIELAGDGDGVTGSIRVEMEGNDVSVGLGVDNDLITRKCRECLEFGNMDRDEANFVGCQVVDSSRSGAVLSDHVNGRVNEPHGNGIKGVRPSVLTPPALDKDCLAWDLYETSVPPNRTHISRIEYGVCLDEAGQQKHNEDEDNEEHKRRRTKAGEENCLLSGSCSFSTISHDDDSSSTSTDPFSSVSSDGRFGRVIVEWQKGELLGRGSFGSVYEGISDNGFFFAVKEVSLLDQGDEGKQRIIQLEQEIALLSQFKHENIVQYYGTKKAGSHLYIFLELVIKGSLLSLYQKYNLRDSQVSAYTRQILHGLKYLHDRNVVHRDIKCANILVDTNGLVKLADFGLAKATKLNDVNSCKGTAFWMAPEVVRSLGYGLAADIWSLGCTVLEMLTRRFPYHNLECMAALFRIGKGERPPIPDSLSSDARDFVFKCLQVDPSSRPSAEQLLDHPFVRQPLPSSSCFASPRYFGQHS